MKKRILSILLALCMLFCLVPTTAFAEGETNRKVETEQELVDALSDSSVDIITLKNDIAIGTTLTVLRKVTLDLNGYVLKMTGSGSVIILDNKSGITGDLTLIDSNPTAEHKFKVNGAEPWVLDNSGTETVYGGIITGGTGSRIFFSDGVSGGGVIIGSGALTMNGGNIVGCIANRGGGLFLSDGSFTMNAGSIVGCSTPKRLTTGEAFHGGIYAFGPMANGDTTGVITLTGGLIKNNGRYAINAAYHTTIYANGGEVYGEVHLNQACKITCLAEDNGITAFKGKTVISGASVVNANHVDWGLFYGGLYIYGNTTTGVIVTYKDGDSEYAKQVLPSGTLATRPDAPAATPGYTFGGWNKADGTAWDYASDKVTDNITLYAKWTANTYTVTFDSTGGSAVDAQPVAYGEKAKKPAAPQKTGYAFGGWYLGDTKYDFAAVVTEDMTLTAKWTVCGHKGSTAQPTCTDAVKCTVCGSTLPALGHEWGPWTSGSDNTHTRACKRDGAHTETKSCVDADRDHMCDACGQTISGHTGGTATCTAKAVCSVCGQSYGAVDTANHDLKHTAAKEPGAFVTGRIEYWTCRTCGKYFADAGGAKEISRDDIIIPRLGAAADSEGGKASPATFDAGIGVTAVTAVTSLAGLALLRRKRRDGE